MPQPTLADGCYNPGDSGITTGSRIGWLSQADATTSHGAGSVDVTLTSSSSLAGLTATDALPSSTHGWSAATNDDQQWIAVDLDRTLMVEALSLWSRGDADEWVTQFSVSHSLDGQQWMWIIDPLDYYSG